MMYNNDLYEKAIRERHRDLQREMEQLRLLKSLQRPTYSVRRAIEEQAGILLTELGMKHGRTSERKSAL